MDEALTFVVRVGPAVHERPWRASLNDPSDGSQQQFDTAQTLARYLERLKPRDYKQGPR